MTKATYILRSRGYQVRWKCIEHIESLDLEGDTPHEIVIRPYKSSRSIEQNNLLHSWLRAIAEETGHTVEEMSAFIERVTHLGAEVGAQLPELKYG